MSARDISRKELEESLLTYGVTMRWHENPDAFHEDEGAGLKLYGQYFGAYYSLMKKRGDTRRGARATIIKEIKEHIIPSRTRLKKRENGEPLYEALAALLKYTGGRDAAPDHPCAKARVALEQATYSPERNIAEQEKKRAAIAAEQKEKAS